MDSIIRGEAALLVPAMAGRPERLPKNVEDGVLLGQGELEVICKLLALAAGTAP